MIIWSREYKLVTMREAAREMVQQAKGAD